MVAGTTRIQREIFDTDASAVSAVSGKPGSRVYTKESKMFIFNDGDALHEEKEYEDAISGLGSAVSESTGSVAALTGSLASLQQQINDVEASISTIPQGPQGPQGPAGTGGYRFTSLTPVKGHTYSYANPSADQANSFVGVPLDLFTYAIEAGYSAIHITPDAFYNNYANDPLWMGEWGTTGTNYLALYPSSPSIVEPDTFSPIGTAAFSPGTSGIFPIVSGDSTVGWVTVRDGVSQRSWSSSEAQFLPAPISQSSSVFLSPGVLLGATIRFKYAFTIVGYPNAAIGLRLQPVVEGMVDTFPTLLLDASSNSGTPESYYGEFVITIDKDGYADMTNSLYTVGTMFGLQALKRETRVFGEYPFPDYGGLLFDLRFMSDDGGSYGHSLDLIYCEGRIDPPNS